MEAKSSKKDNNTLEITVVLSAQEVQKEIDAAYKQAGKNRIPGFRPGKAPRKILENHFGGKDYFLAQATDELVRSNTPLAADDLNIVPLSNPEFSSFDLVKEGESFTFAYSVEAAPELELSSYDPIQIELPSAEPTAEELQQQIDTLLAYNTTTDDEGNEQKPELTDAWVKETLEFDSVDDFKERIAESIRAQKGQDLPTLREFLSTQEIAKRLVGEVPESMVSRTEQDNYRDLFQSLQKQRMTLDNYLENYGYTSETFRDSMRQQALDSASMALALDAMARHLNLTVSEGEIIEEFEQSGAPDAQKLFENWRANGRLSEIRQGLARIKAAKHVYDTAEIFEPGTLWVPAEDVPVSEASEAEKKPAKKVAKTAKEEAAAAEVEGNAENAKPAKKTTVKSSAKDKAAIAEKKPSRKAAAAVKAAKAAADATTTKAKTDTKKSPSPASKSAKVDSNKRKEEE